MAMVYSNTARPVYDLMLALLSMTSSDYYVENGKYVFTEDYLKARGFCCGNGCRHCPYQFVKPNKRIVSLVPSWTETLLQCGMDLVGRTRFCIHPVERVKDIPIVGGTKNCDFNKISELNPDLVLIDKEENPREFDETITAAKFISHITNQESLFSDLCNLNKILKNAKLNELIQIASLLKPQKARLNFENLPGLKKWIKKPSHPQQIKHLIYVIWRNPWMRVGPQTYIGSQLSYLGFDHLQVESKSPYPEFNLEDFDKSSTLFLFSSEPFPFEKKEKDLAALNLYSALVDGEGYSWFGHRGINFLKQNLVDNLF